MSRYEGLVVTLSEDARTRLARERDPGEDPRNARELVRDAILSIHWVADVRDSTDDGDLVVVFKDQLRSDEHGGWALRAVSQLKGVASVEPLESDGDSHAARSAVHGRLLALSNEFRGGPTLEPTPEAAIEARVRLEAGRELLRAAAFIYGTSFGDVSRRDSREVVDAMTKMVENAKRR